MRIIYDRKQNPTSTLWLDLEMTGLDPDSERIIEIATVVTNADLEEIKEGPNLVIKQPQEYIEVWTSGIKSAH
ncbi:MAG: hypothetical protein CM1200mP12_20630 [Gammaproteobacteria bacterium]|nr:MAG: hypothetical protein CM1200mP12_20630 [Gammaproteobacteria bacterium]